MKGLLRGLRYISHVFEEEEKEAEIQIGYPTDVKHVAHIGWDGPSASAPTWMNDFKSSNGDENKDEEALKNVSPDSTKNRVRDSPGRDLPINLPKSSRRQPSTDSLGSLDSPTASPKSSKTSRRRPKHKESSSPKAGESSSSQGGAPNIPKKSRRKKSKDEDSTHSSRSKERSRRGSRLGSDDGSVKQFGSDSELATSPREEDQG